MKRCNESIERFGETLVHVPSNPRAETVFWAQWSALHQDRFRYTMGPDRSEMFDNFADLVENKKVIRADCSQWAAAILRHVGVKGLKNTDFTGSLLDKGNSVRPSKAKPADVIIFGPGTGEHAAIKTYNGYCIGFGHWPGAPNRLNIVEFAAWFAQHGYPGVRYLSFMP